MAARLTEVLLPVGRRPELLARPIVAPQAVIGGPLFGILEDLVGLLHVLELRLRVPFLAHVGVILAGELAIRALDLVGVRASLHAQSVVIVLELH